MSRLGTCKWRIRSETGLKGEGEGGKERAGKTNQRRWDTMVRKREKHPVKTITVQGKQEDENTAMQSDWRVEARIQGNLDLFIWILVEVSPVWREARQVCSELTVLPEWSWCKSPVTFHFSYSCLLFLLPFYPSPPFPPAFRSIGQIRPCASSGLEEKAH